MNTESESGTTVPDQHSFCNRRSRFWVDTEQYLSLNRQDRGQNLRDADDLRQP